MTVIKAETFNFLKDLDQHNDRDWFAKNKERYEVAKQNVEDLAAYVLELMPSFDDRISKDISPKKSVLRIYRDIRFSKVKTPYKTNLGISVSEKGRGGAGDIPGYYIHIEPGKSFVAGGYWMPQAAHLKLIRQEIDYNTSDFLKIIQSSDFQKYYKGLSTEDSLKFAPKGYEADHPYIDILKLKSFICSASFSDEELQTKAGIDKMIKGLKLITPLNHFLKDAIS